MQNQKYLFFNNWIKKVFSEENTVPRMMFEARKLAGSATYKQVNQYEIGP